MADANGPTRYCTVPGALAKFEPRTCRFHMHFRRFQMPAGAVVESKLRQRRALEPICFHWRGTSILSHKLPASISNCIFTNARPWGSRGSSSPSRLIIAADLGLTIDCIDSNENLCPHAKNAHSRLRAGLSLQGCRATTALLEQVQRQH